jgi:hypothetical protein
MGIGRRIRRGIRRVTRPIKSIAGKALGAISKPLGALSKLTGPLQKIMGGILDKMPFGKLIKPFMQQFMNNPLAMMAGGPLGMLGGMMGMAGNVGNLAGCVGGLSGAMGGNLADTLSPQGLQNVTGITAHAHAQLMIRQFGL